MSKSTSQHQPTRLEVTNIPKELIARNQWVLWKYEIRDRKPTKVPYDSVSKRRASSTDPKTWSSFEHAVAVDDFDGIGFVLTKTDPFVGIDLDHCLDPKTGVIEPWVQEIVTTLDSFTEITPSRTGLHIWVRAKLPGSHYRPGVFEIYDHARYLTITGLKLSGSPGQIMERTAEVKAVYTSIFPPEPPRPTPVVTNRLEMSDEEIIGYAATAANSEKFIRLWMGEDFIDHSAADMALCCLLAFWTGNVEQMDRLFRLSRLMRPKWNRRDYRERTINRAIELTTEVFGG